MKLSICEKKERANWPPEYEPIFLGPNVKNEFETVGDISDGYHTFNELYHHRAAEFSLIVSLISAGDIDNCRVWKSKNHHDPDFPMYTGMFIVGIDTPFGQMSYHYDVDPYWELFHCEELERAPMFDGHTPDDVVDRMFKLSRHLSHNKRNGASENGNN